MSQAKFNLRSWSTNSDKLRAVTGVDQTSDPNPTVGLVLLGLRWNTSTDIISLTNRKLPTIGTLLTKRDVLQTSSQIFDPLGWATPVTVKTKILMQEIWQAKLPWDEPLPQTFKDKWIDTLADLQELPQLVFPQCYFPSNEQGTQIDAMFVFADASTKAYSAVVYLNSGNNVCMAMSKARVAPTSSIILYLIPIPCPPYIWYVAAKRGYQFHSCPLRYVAAKRGYQFHSCLQQTHTCTHHP